MKKVYNKAINHLLRRKQAMSQQKFERLESDSIGTKSVPRDAYYEVQSLRAFENFHITGQRP